MTDNDAPIPDDPSPPPLEREERIQELANILSLIAIVGRMDKMAIQRVLVSLGSTLMEVPGTPAVDRELASQLIASVAHEGGEEAALALTGDMVFIAEAWGPVLDEYSPLDPYRLMPFAEILFQLVNHSGGLLQSHDAFERFGGTDGVLPLNQLTAALRPYPAPAPGLRWELVGFSDPPDQALVGSDESIMYLFKAASSGIDLRFSELERNAEAGARREYDVRIDTPLFAAFVAGLLGDMLYWTARLRSHALPGQEMWHRVQTLLMKHDRS
jgi:hypothetical protein